MDRPYRLDRMDGPHRSHWHDWPYWPHRMDGMDGPHGRNWPHRAYWPHGLYRMDGCNRTYRRAWRNRPYWGRCYRPYRSHGPDRIRSNRPHWTDWFFRPNRGQG